MKKRNESNITTNNTQLYNLLKNYSKEDIVFVCIGTDKNTGDSYGPLVGMYLKEHCVKNVYGELQNTVNAKNIGDVYEKIKTNHPNGFIVCIDACGVKKDNIGKILYKNKSLEPGSGLNKNLGKYGDYSILGGIYDQEEDFPFLVLQNTSLAMVVNLAKETCNSIVELLERLT